MKNTNGESDSETRVAIVSEFIELVELMARNHASRLPIEFSDQLRANLANALEMNPLSAERINELLVRYIELQIVNKTTTSQLGKILLLAKKYKRISKSTDKGGRPQKNASLIGELLAEEQFNKSKKFPSAERLSRLVAQRLQPHAPLEDENGRRCLSLSGARNCIQRVRHRMTEKNFSQKLLSDLLGLSS